MAAVPSIERSLCQALAERARQQPDHIAFVETAGTTTYRQLWQRVGRLAQALTDAGVAQGERIGIWLDNSADFAAAYYACLGRGAIAIALNTTLKAPQLDAQLRHAEASAVLGRGAAPEGLSWVARWVDLDHVEWGGPDSFSLTEAPLDEPAAIIYTSGTTGRPKGVALSGRNLAANVASINAYLGLGPGDRTLCVLPFYYSYGNSVLHTHLAAGATLVLENSFLYPQVVLQRMAQEQVTGFAGVPATFALLLNRCDLSKMPLPSLRYVTQAGGAMKPEHIRRLLAAWPQVRFYVMYGQTEATARLTYLPPERLPDKLGTVGIPIPGVTIKILDDAGNELPAGERGEICARGPNTMLGYWRDEAATHAKYFGPWLRTGDEGFCDADGFITIVGRRSDMIKSGAHRIAPEEIEQVIASLDGVDDVAVVGAPDEMLGEQIRAYVTARADAGLSKRSVLAHCNRQLPKYKLPKAVYFVDQLPRTASGKIQRFKLLEQNANQGSAPERQ